MPKKQDRILCIQIQAAPLVSISYPVSPLDTVHWGELHEKHEFFFHLSAKIEVRKILKKELEKLVKFCVKWPLVKVRGDQWQLSMNARKTDRFFNFVDFLSSKSSFLDALNDVTEKLKIHTY